MKNEEVPTTVHALGSADIKCVAVMGDGMTDGLGAHAITPIGLLSKNRGKNFLSQPLKLPLLLLIGVAWSTGGHEEYERLVSLSNILRQYNPALKDYSTGITTIFPDGQNATHNRLNVGWC
jgi:phospholipase B1